MPCVSDYMEATGGEKELSRVLCLLDELRGVPIDKNDWEGYKAGAYNAFSQERLDAKTAELCSTLKKLNKPALQQYSLELQMWWRDHQAADRRREFSK